MTPSDHGDAVRAGDAEPSRGEVAASSRGRFKEFLSKRPRRGVKGGKPGAVHSPADPLEPPRPPRHRSFVVLLGQFWRMLRGHRLLVCASVATLTVSTICGLAMPASTKIALDFVLTDNPGPSGLPDWVPTRDRMGLLVWLGAALIALNIVSIGAGIWGRWHMTRLTKRMQGHVRRRVFDHAVRLPLHRVYQIKSGGAASMLREDAGQAAQLLFSLLYNPWRAIIQLLGTLIILASVDWVLLLGATALIPAAWFTQKAWIGRIRPLQKEVRNTRQQIDAHATEAFGGMRVVRGFSRERGEAARFIRGNHLLFRQELLAWVWSRTIEIVWHFLLPLGSVGVLLYGGWRVIHGTLTLGDVMMFSAYLIMLLSPLEALTVSATSIQSELAAFDRVLDLLAEPEEFQRRGSEPSAHPIEPAEVAGRVFIAGVSFHYPGREEWVLSDIDLDVPPGSTVALVGRSGAGKTTLCNLVARFYDPVKGRILLDGADLKSIDAASYRRLLGIVEQDVFLFDGSVRENIAYARRGATLEEIAAAARAANADEFIRRLERGYDTLIGERGVRLSGGQKQRIAIARAVLADPRILILDEATSNLDSESEALIQESLRGLMRGRTCLVIAHRLSTIRHADLIVVLEQGRIAERGTHVELVQREGLYWQMLQLQLARRAEHEDRWAEPGREQSAGHGR